MKRAISLIFLFVLISGLGATQEGQPFQLSVNVDLVLLNATVRDQKGRAAPDLRVEDFEVLEDGILQSIRLFRHEDVPVTVGLVIDHSGSMRSKMESVVLAAQAFIGSRTSEDQTFIINFNENVMLGLPAELAFSNSAKDLTHAISRTPATGMTALYDAVWKAREWVTRGSHDKKVLIVISDGADNASEHTLAQLLQEAKHSNIQIFTIGIFDPDDPDRNPSVLRRLAHTTGGESFIARELDEVVNICESIAKDIRSQYALGYISSQVRQGSGYHNIKVLARSKNRSSLTVRTRSGYSYGSALRLGGLK